MRKRKRGWREQDLWGRIWEGRSTYGGTGEAAAAAVKNFEWRHCTSGCERGDGSGVAKRTISCGGGDEAAK